jgi:hypothetical protein
MPDLCVKCLGTKGKLRLRIVGVDRAESWTESSCESALPAEHAKPFDRHGSGRAF